MSHPGRLYETLTRLDAPKPVLISKSKNDEFMRSTGRSKRPLRGVVTEEDRGRIHKVNKKQNVEDCIAYFHKAKVDQEQQLLDLKKNHDAWIQRVAGLRAVYLYGLEHIANLQDLRKAPDAILPNSVPAVNEQKRDKKP